MTSTRLLLHISEANRRHWWTGQLGYFLENTSGATR